MESCDGKCRKISMDTNRRAQWMGEDPINADGPHSKLKITSDIFKELI